MYKIQADLWIGESVVFEVDSNIWEMPGQVRISGTPIAEKVLTQILEKGLWGKQSFQFGQVWSPEDLSIALLSLSWVDNIRSFPV